MTKPRVIIIPGNGGSHIETDHWYAWVRDELRSRGYAVVAEDMPDPIDAHMNIWLPHIAEHFHADEQTVIIGHSSGAVATLRYLETHSLAGAVLVGCNHTDLGDEMEKASGYFDTPWQWAQIKSHAGWIAQFASTDDPYINIAEPRFIHEQLNTEYYELTNRGHFMLDHNPINSTFPEVIDVLSHH